MKLYAKELATKLLESYKSYLEKPELTDNDLWTTVLAELEFHGMEGESLTVEGMKVRTCIEFEKKPFISTIEYGIEIEVEYNVGGIYFTVFTKTKNEFMDEIFRELEIDLQTEMDHRFMQHEQDLEDDEL